MVDRFDRKRKEETSVYRSERQREVEIEEEGAGVWDGIRLGERKPGEGRGRSRETERGRGRGIARYWAEEEG